MNFTWNEIFYFFLLSALQFVLLKIKKFEDNENDIKIKLQIGIISCLLISILFSIIKLIR